MNKWWSSGHKARLGTLLRPKSRPVNFTKTETVQKLRSQSRV